MTTFMKNGIEVEMPDDDEKIQTEHDHRCRVYGEDD